MGDSTVVIQGGRCSRVTIGNGASRRVTIDASTIAKINDNRPRNIVQTRNTPVNVTERDTLVKTGGGMGVQGRPGAPGGSIPAINFAFGDASSIVWTPATAGLLSYVRVIIGTPFNGVGAAISVGTNADHEAALPAAYCDPTAAQEFENTPDIRLAAGEGVRLTIAPGAGATLGAGTLLLEFLPE